jgi:hypothetical protein
MKTLALPLNLRDLSRLRPVGDEKDALIAAMFKEEYRAQLQTWALTTAESRRKLLYGLLSCEPRAKLPATARAAAPGFDATRHDEALVSRTATARIDFNHSFTGVPSQRRLNVRRFASPGTDAVFHRTPLPPLTAARPLSSLAEFIVKKLMTPLAAESVLPVADDYLDILQDLLGWVEKKQMHYPVDRMWHHPTLSPNTARVVNQRRFEEDHNWRPQFDPRPPALPRTQGARRKYQIKTGTSTYEDFLGMDARCGAEPSRSSPIVPMTVARPFGLFPAVEQDPYPVSEAISRQFGHNMDFGRANKAIFEAETCL